MGTISDKLTYLNTTKSQLKDMINYGLDDNDKITSSTTFRNYVSSIFNAFLEALRNPDTLFNNLPKKSGSGSNITLNNTANAPMRIELGSRALEQATTTGKNIFDLKKFITDSGGTYTENADGSITLTPLQPMYSTPYVFSDTDINVSLSGLITLGTATNVRIQLLNSNNVSQGIISADTSTLENKTASKLRFDWTIQGTCTFKNIMLNTGSTTQPFEPYTGGIPAPNPQYPQDIHTISGSNTIKVEGKNRFGKELFDTSLWNVSGTDSEFTIQAKSSGTTAQNIPYNFSTCSFKGTIIYESMNGSIVLREDTTSRATILAVFDNSSSSTDKDLQVSNPVDNLRIVVYSTSSKITFKNCQLESGTTATTYEPYTSQEAEVDLDTLEYCKIGTYADEFIREEDGTWQLKKNIGKVVLDGSEAWEQTGETAVSSFVMGVGVFDTDLKGNQSAGYSNYFKCKYSNEVGAFYFNNSTPAKAVLCLENTYTLETFKTWLGTHNTEIYYVLATPTYTDITGTLAEQLEYVYKNMLSQEGQTNISQVNNDLSFVINASAIEEV